jgi:YesN/AraC family two-component response regulator
MKANKLNKLFIKNMVCQRCILTVESILARHQVENSKVVLGEVDLTEPLGEQKLNDIKSDLKQVGFEVIETRVTKIIEDIKKLVLKYFEDQESEKKLKLSSFITNQIHYDYSYLSDLFSSIEGITIEQYFIMQRIEKVKELMVYEQLSLTEISYQTGFSSVHHLSTQFKKLTGLSPSHFKKIAVQKRKSIDKL